MAQLAKDKEALVTRENEILAEIQELEERVYTQVRVVVCEAYAAM